MCHATSLHSFYQRAVKSLEELAWQTNKGVVLANALIQSLRSRSILLPSMRVIEHICAEALTRLVRTQFIVLNKRSGRNSHLGIQIAHHFHGQLAFAPQDFRHAAF